jgi:dTDP-4-dehydrorhamnose reductase
MHCTLVQVSTAYVFDGQERWVPYREFDPARPISEYGRSKLAGETLATEHSRHFIVRTGPMFGLRPPQAKTTNFVDLMLRLGQTQPVVRVVNDQRCSPSHVRDIATAIQALLAAEKLGTAAYGIYHIAGRREATWHELAAEIFRRAKLPATLVGVSTAEFAAAAPRPLYAVLDTEKYRALGGPEPRGWSEALTEYLAELGDSWRLPSDLAR